MMSEQNWRVEIGGRDQGATLLGGRRVVATVIVRSKTLSTMETLASIFLELPHLCHHTT